ncbi:BTAD domain-containing putative transcriptional regulator [Sphaerisporangium flaviroseum]|uniref:BTAD domain-containing putative transcriptional regulator n=1 Tax=Sphaerisporangium flaviroseum TaxID=509199 RepID=A0ABP7J0X5_9ACTN
MKFRLLGPVEVWHEGRPVPLGGAKPRALLAALLIEPGRVVSSERLIDAIWADDPPTTARRVLYTYVASLRRAFASAGLPTVIVSHHVGYLAQIPPRSLDKDVFEQNVAEGRDAARKGDQQTAATIFRAALSLWHGTALGGIGDSFLRAEADRLEELKLAVIEERVAADLATGKDEQLIEELTELVTLYPARERLRRDLMVTLYRAGRQTDALAVYQYGRQVLIDELGIEPGPELRQAQAAILRSDPALLNGVKVGIRMPRQLPLPVSDFTGRADEMAELYGHLTRPAAVPLCVISGQGGAGKSALALQTAYKVASHYPDGQLYVELRGTSDAPVAPEEALGRLLRELDPQGTPIPGTLEERAVRYRTLLAGRRKLILLDDAASESQVRALLPGGRECAVIITSRNRLAGLASASFVDVGLLPRECAYELLSRIIGPERTAADPDAAWRVVSQCGGLPLALRVAGARLASRRQWTVARLAERLADENRRLDELAVGDQAVRASIGLSYQILPPLAATALRRLGMLGMPHFTAWVAAVAIETSLDVAERVLEQLVDASLVDLVDADPSEQIHYRLHDLIRLFAKERAQAEETEQERMAVVTRVLGGWLWLMERLSEAVLTGMIPTRATIGLTYPVDVEVVRVVLADPHAWIRREEESLVVAVELAAAMDLDEIAVELASALSAAAFEGNQYILDNPFAAWNRMHQAALAVARRMDNTIGEAKLLAGLGHLSYESDLYAESREYLSQALSLFRTAGDIRGEASTLAALGSACRDQGYLPEALHFLVKAEDLWEDLADSTALAHVKRLTSMVHLERGDYAAAWAGLTAALALYQQGKNRRGEGMVLRNMSMYHRARGELDSAEKLCENALAIFHDIGDRLMVAYCHRALAKTYVRQERYDEARESLEESLIATRTLNDRWGEACTLRVVGELYLAEGRLYQAKTSLEESLQLWDKLRNALFRARTLRDLAQVHQALGENATAEGLRSEAMEIFRLHGAREYAESLSW